jgi:hypothetical protein
LSSPALPVPGEIGRTASRALAVGGAGVALTLLGALLDREQFFRSWLLAWLFFMNLAVGCLSVLMIQHLTGGRWGIAIRRTLEAGTRTLPLVALLFVPVALGVSSLYEWSHAEAVAADPILQHKASYLNLPFFLGRAVFYFVVWLGLARLANRWSLEQDEEGTSPALAGRFEALGGIGLLLLGLTVTFSSVDWGMSLNAHWFSTIYGVLFMVGQALAALAFATLTVARFSDREPLSRVIAAETIHDLGKLMLAFVMLWAYVNLSQFLIVWSGNLPEEIPWYAARMQGGWEWLGAALIVLHFALPFTLLLSRDIKRDAGLLSGIAAGLLLMRLVDLYWLVGPDLHGHGGHAPVAPHWMDVTAVVGLGGLWLWRCAGQLQTRPLLPVGEPEVRERLEEASA